MSKALRAVACCFLLSCSVAFGGPKELSSPPAQARAKEYLLYICNKTGEPNIDVAVALYDDPDDNNVTVRGWYQLKPNECAHWTRNLGSYSSHEVFYHAESGNLNWWNEGQADMDLCVVKHDAFERHNSKNYNCKKNEKLVGFAKLKVVEGENKLNVVR